MNDLDYTLLSKEDLQRVLKEKDKAIFALVAEGHEKDKIIKNLRFYVEDLDRKKLVFLNRILELRTSLNAHKDCHRQEIALLEDEVETRDEEIKELEEKLRILKENRRNL